MKTYTDDVGGISLRYPAVWTFSKTADSYFPSVIAPNGEPVQAVFSFSPEDSYYAHTTLTGLQFLYRRTTETTGSACELILSANRGDASPIKRLTIRGIPFARLGTGEAGMMKSVSQEAYATWRDGTCYLFEADLSLIAEGIDNAKTRDLGSSEVRALRRHLSEILKSVRLRGPNASNQYQRRSKGLGYEALPHR